VEIESNNTTEVETSNSLSICTQSRAECL